MRSKLLGTIASALETRGTRTTVSFRGSSTKRFLQNAKIVGHSRLDDDVTAVVISSTEGLPNGLIPLLLGWEAVGWQELVTECPPGWVGQVGRLLDEMISAYVRSDDDEDQGPAGTSRRSGSLSTDGLFVSIDLEDGWRNHFPLSGGELPQIRRHEVDASSQSLVIELSLPDGQELILQVNRDGVVDAEKAITMLGSRGAVSSDVSSGFLAAARERPTTEPHASWSPPVPQASRGTANHVADFNAAVAAIEPYLRNPAAISSVALLRARDLQAAATFVIQHSRSTRGPGFEMLRALSATRHKAMFSDPKDSMAVRLVGRVLAGRGDDDAAVISMVDTDVKELNRLAALRLIELSLLAGPSYLAQQEVASSVGRLIIETIFGLGAPARIDEAAFAQCFETYRRSLERTLRSPGVLGNLMASQGGLDLSAMRKADKRAERGRYSSSDLQALEGFAASYRPAVRSVARFQHAMGWSPTNWDPVQIVYAMRSRK